MAVASPTGESLRRLPVCRGPYQADRADLEKEHFEGGEVWIESPRTWRCGKRVRGERVRGSGFRGRGRGAVEWAYHTWYSALPSF